MSAKKLWKLLPALLLLSTGGAAYAKLPPPPPVDPVKAEEAKKKAAEAAQKDAEALGRAQDRAVERYKREKAGGSAAAKAPAAGMKPK